MSKFIPLNWKLNQVQVDSLVVYAGFRAECSPHPQSSYVASNDSSDSSCLSYKAVEDSSDWLATLGVPKVFCIGWAKSI